MANRIIDFSSTAANSKSLELYNDICMVADRTNYLKPTLQLEDEYIAYLVTEAGTGNLKKIVTEQFTDGDAVWKEIVLYYNHYENYEQALAAWAAKSKWKLARAINVRSVQQCLDNIFTWQKGERILEPEFGTDLRKFLYEGLITKNEELIVAEIKNAVSRWEPRVNIVDILNVRTDFETEDNTVHLEIIYTIPSLSNEQFNYSLRYS